MKHKKTSFAAAVAACALLVCICAGFATSAASAPVRTIEQLTDSVVYANGSLSFTIPKGDGQWNILICGRVEVEDLGGMSVHYLENTDWEAGKSYSFDVSGGGYTELWLDASLGNDEVSVDLTEWLPGELKADSSAGSQQSNESRDGGA